MQDPRLSERNPRQVAPTVDRRDSRRVERQLQRTEIDQRMRRVAAWLRAFRTR